jgi:hypothetical protein
VSEPLPGIESTRFEGFSLSTKFGWMQTGVGAAAVDSGHAYLDAMARTYAESDSHLRTQLGRLGVTWTGQAAEAASGGISRLADYARAAGETSTDGTARLGDYGRSFADMKPHIQYYDPGRNSTGGRLLDGLMGDAAGWLDIQSDYRRRLQVQRQYDQRANDALYAHQSATQRLLADFPAGDPAPTVSTGADAPSHTSAAGAGVPGPGGHSGPAAAGAGAAPHAGGFAPPPGAGSRLPGTTPGQPIGPRPGTPGIPQPGDGATGPSSAPPEPPPPNPSHGPEAPQPHRPTAPGPAIPQTVDPGPRTPDPGTRLPETPETRLPPEPPGTRLPPDPAGTRLPSDPPGTRLPAEPPGSRLPTRAPNPAEPPRSTISEALAGPPATTRSPGAAAMPPLAGGLGGAHREHRNQVYLPSDEPFAVELSEYEDYTPPVLGDTR